MIYLHRHNVADMFPAMLPMAYAANSTLGIADALEAPDDAIVQELADKCKALDCPLWLDLEPVPNYRWADTEIERYIDAQRALILRFRRAGVLRILSYNIPYTDRHAITRYQQLIAGPTENRNWWTAQAETFAANYNAWRAQFGRLSRHRNDKGQWEGTGGLIDHLDAISPSMFQQAGFDWRLWQEPMIRQCQALQKPIVPWLWVRYLDQRESVIPADEMRAQCEALAALGVRDVAIYIWYRQTREEIEAAMPTYRPIVDVFGGGA